MAEGAETRPTITPYLYYEDVGAALEWLARAFGFRERAAETMKGADGRVLHTAMDAGDGGVVMMGCPGSDYRSPKRAQHVTQNLYVYVSDVEAHCERARRAGAVLLEEPEDTFYGDRRYGAEDLEGHHWYFAQRLREIPPGEWRPAPEDLHGRG